MPYEHVPSAQVAQLQSTKLDAMNAFYIATLGSAKSLSLDKRVGNFLPGKEADFVCLDLEATPLLKYVFLCTCAGVGVWGCVGVRRRLMSCVWILKPLP